MKNEKLTGKDLITLGIFGALGLVSYLIISTVLCLTIIGSLAATAVASLVTGCIYMLMAAKVKKPGVFLIASVTYVIISLTGGHFYHAIASLIGGLLGELCAGKYKSIKRIILGYVVYCFGNFLGVYLPNFLLGADYMADKIARFNLSAEEAAERVSYFSMPTLGIISVANIICAFLGAIIGIKIVKKHFEKAGLI